MRRSVRVAASVALASLVLNLGNTPVMAQFNWSQVPAMIDVSGRINDTEKQIVEGLAAGRLTQPNADALKGSLDKIRQRDTQYRQDGKLSVFERMRLVLDLDKLSGEIQANLSNRSVAITDVSGKEAEIEKNISDALLSGRLTTLESTDFSQKLDAIKDKEKAFRTDGVLSTNETLTLSLDLDNLASDIESSLKVRIIEDPGVDAKQAEIKKKIDDLVLTGKLTTQQAEPLRQELARIRIREESFKLSGGQFTSEEILTLALELERLKSRVDRYEPQIIPTAVKGIDDRQDEVKKAIVSGQSAGKLTVQQAGELAQEFDRIEALEAMYRVDGVLSDSEILTLARDLDTLKKRVDEMVAKVPDAAPGISERKEALRKRITGGKAASLITPATLADELLSELSRIESKEAYYKLDGSLSDTETLILAQDIDRLTGRLESNLHKLPNLTEKRAEVEKKLNEALASGRLDPAKLNDFKQDLNRIAFLESTFKSNDGQIDDREAVALSKEFDNLDKAMAATVQPLPDIDKLQADIKKKLLDARAAGKLSASNAATLESDFNRIDGIEKSFRSSNTNLSEWETMSLKRDLDRLSLDLDRLAVDTPKVEVDTSALAADTRGHWAEKYIAILQQQGTIGGFPDGSFKPDNGITRAQFAAIAAKALNIPEAGRDAKFADLSKKHWAYKAISAVNDAGLVGGYPDGSFRPEDKITRTQAFVILSKALNNAKADPDVLSRYKDGKSVAIWAVPSVAKAVNAGIVVNHPDPYAIRPDAQATRAEVAALTYQTMASLGQKLPAIRIGLEASGN